MGGFSALMNREVFGVKVLYLLGVLVVVFAVYAWRMKPGVSESEAVEPSADAAPDGAESLADAVGGYPDVDGVGTVIQTGSGSSGPVYSQPADRIDSNDEWLRAAIEYLITQGATPEAATAAIQRYIAGDQLSWEQGELRDKAVMQIGLPPDIPPTGGTASKPVTGTTARQGTPPLVHRVKGTTDNTYGKLAALYYGSTVDKYIDLIQSANTGLGHAAPSGGWKTGTAVFIPVKVEPRYYTVVKGKQTAAAIAGANGITTKALAELNDGLKYPVKVGRKVRVK